MHYRVTLGDVIAAHDEALTYGGRAGVISLDAVQSAIGRPYSGYHRPIARKAAALLHALIQNHGFVDGNKRTALLVTGLMMRRSGYVFSLDQDERIDDIVVAVADGKMSFDDLVLWMKYRIVRA
ncbi:MAG: type II toxin-antitoxin system death-on-curing family toxin [Albidovulum sp.]